jgi:hypothetical protein
LRPHYGFSSPVALKSRIQILAIVDYRYLASRGSIGQGEELWKKQKVDSPLALECPALCLRRFHLNITVGFETKYSAELDM